MALQSQLFRGDLKLEASATSDPAHILRGATGPHVHKIQQALIQIEGAAITPDSTYGHATAAAVSAFKRKRQILNSHGTIDDIVGKKTIVALDGELLAKEKTGGGSRGRLGFGITGDGAPPIGVKKQLDIFVQFEGALGAQEGTRNTVAEDDLRKRINTPAYLQTHQPVAPVIFFGGRGANDRSAAVIAEVLALRAVSTDGVTVILGESSGGLPALRAAAVLGRVIRLDYVAISDGAFFETGGEVIFNLQSRLAPIQVVMPGRIDANKKDNFFQTFGHNTLKDPRNSSGFMNGTEFHLPLDGFNNVPMEKTSAKLIALMTQFDRTPFADSLPLFVKKFLFADPAHVAAGRDAEALAFRVVQTLIKP